MVNSEFWWLLPQNRRLNIIRSRASLSFVSLMMVSDCFKLTFTHKYLVRIVDQLYFYAL